MSWLRCVAWRWGVFLRGWKESKGDNGKEGCSREVESFFCSCFEWDIVCWWNTAGKHQDTIPRVSSVVQTQEHVLTALQRKLLCLIFSFLYTNVLFGSNSLLASGLLCSSGAELAVKRIEGFSDADLESSGVLYGWCHGREPRSHTASHWLVSTETWVFAQFHPT